MTAASSTKASFYPPLDRKVLIALGLSGIAALIAFDVFGQLLSPAAGFVELTPVALAELVIAKLFGVTTSGGAYVLHFLTGLLFYPVGYLFAARPVAQAFAPRTPWWVVGTELKRSPRPCRAVRRGCRQRGGPPPRSPTEFGGNPRDSVRRHRSVAPNAWCDGAAGRLAAPPTGTPPA